ncbi:hypothetical protein C8R47DRAFT_1329137 [Mycena vitilis]|nr:hypothetical protein C8R47DRAFT_1329137 [Mycena vitilis]
MAEKRKANDENSSQFINISGPPQKRLRRVAQTVTEASRAEARQQWEEKQREEAAARAELDAQRKREEEAEKRATSSFRIGQVLDAVKTAGYRTLHEFLADLLAAKDAHQSSQVSQTLINHGDELLDLIRRRQPDLVSQWGQGVSTTLESFSLAQVLADAEYHAPTLCMLLRSLAREEADEEPGKQKRRDVDLVLSTVICMLVQTRNEKSSEYAIPNIDNDIFTSQDGRGHLQLGAKRFRAEDFFRARHQEINVDLISFNKLPSADASGSACSTKSGVVQNGNTTYGAFEAGKEAAPGVRSTLQPDFNVV